MDGNRYTVDKSIPDGVFLQDDFGTATRFLFNSQAEPTLQAFCPRNVERGSGVSKLRVRACYSRSKDGC